MTPADLGPARGRSAADVLTEALARVVYPSPAATRAAPHVRAAESTDALLRQLVLASLPAVAVGLWSLGATIARTADGGEGPVLAGWRRDFIVLFDPNVTAGWLDSFMIGLLYFLPLLLVSAAVCVFWEVVFAMTQARRADSAWLMTAWLYCALLPASVPLVAAAIGISFGYVFGSQIFGGTGRYLVSPALLGAAFLHVAFPTLFTAPAWVQAYGVAPTWTSLAAGGIGTLAESGATWIGVFAGREAAAFGAPSALACLLGGAYLCGRGVTSWRTIAGGLLGLMLASAALAAVDSPAAQIPWHWHLATGSFAFVLAFVATDPTTMPLTRLARWIHGGLFGALAILIRVANPDHPEGTLFALVLASLFTPLLDHVVVATRMRALRRRRGL
jgi:Na+-transporting NADH:ubiquinone oxidoreductase subunit B